LGIWLPSLADPYFHGFFFSVSFGLDQSKIPVSQRKIVFSMRFLVVNVPYHSECLKGATDKVFEKDLEGEELWTKEQLKIPVFHTGDGA